MLCPQFGMKLQEFEPAALLYELAPSEPLFSSLNKWVRVDGI
jgi:hypothetical protein